MNDAAETTVPAWKHIEAAFSNSDELPGLFYGQMVTYFVSRTVNDGVPAGDFKGINKKAK